MKILIIHNGYQQSGGEDVVVAQETRLLKQNGHVVNLYKRSNDELDDLSFRQRCGLIGRIISADDTRNAVRKILQDFRPDLVHVHNTFLMVSPSVYEACLEEDVPVVQTLHNYRLLCPAATFYREGGHCVECVTHSLLRSVRYGCYRNSRVMSGAVAFMLKTHRSRQTWTTRIDAYIALSDFARDQFIESGFPADKIHVKSNFVEPDPGGIPHSGEYALFVGRLSPEKGLSTLIEAWSRLPYPVPLVIAGDGPMRAHLEAKVAKQDLSHIHFAGAARRDQVYGMMEKAAFLIVPSIWYEPFGLVIAEAFACGTPVLGASIGAIPTMVDDRVTGLHFDPDDPDAIAEKVAWAWKHLPELAAMGKTARRIYENRYTGNANYHRLMNIYASAIETHTKQPPLRTAA
jgi:glycosyltransferase involved in cell wall biosynthesis